MQALDAATGRRLWSRSLGPPVSRTVLRCGNIDPLGVTGTPVIDPARQALYVAAAVGGGAQGVRHLVFAMALKNGEPLPGGPVDMVEVLMDDAEKSLTSARSRRPGDGRAERAIRAKLLTFDLASHKAAGIGQTIEAAGAESR